MVKTTYRTEKKKSIHTGFEPASHHTCLFSHPAIMQTILILFSLEQVALISLLKLHVTLSQYSNPKSSSITMGSDPLRDRYLFISLKQLF